MSNRGRFVVALLGAGVAVGVVVAATSMMMGGSDCGDEPHPAVPPGIVQSCHDLMVSLSIRTGIAAGVATVFVLLLVTGLFRTSQRMEEDRHAAAIERYREGRPSE
jgi:hypothetical protein